MKYRDEDRRIITVLQTRRCLTVFEESLTSGWFCEVTLSCTKSTKNSPCISNSESPTGSPVVKLSSLHPEQNSRPLLVSQSIFPASPQQTPLSDHSEVQSLCSIIRWRSLGSHPGSLSVTPFMASSIQIALRSVRVRRVYQPAEIGLLLLGLPTLPWRMGFKASRRSMLSRVT